MTNRTSIHGAQIGFAARLALALAVFAVMALATGTSVQAHENQSALKTDPVPKFAAGYVKSKLGAKAVTRARYSRYHTARLRKSYGKAPTQVIADFNGDGKLDWAGLVRTKGGVLNLVVVYSKGKHYRHVYLQRNICRCDNSIGVSVHLQKPGRLKEFPKGNNKPKFVRLRRPGIEFVYFERSSVVFYWKQTKFVSIWTSD